MIKQIVVHLSVAGLFARWGRLGETWSPCPAVVCPGSSLYLASVIGPCDFHSGVAEVFNDVAALRVAAALAVGLAILAAARSSAYASGGAAVMLSAVCGAFATHKSGPDGFGWWLFLAAAAVAAGDVIYESSVDRAVEPQSHPQDDAAAVSISIGTQKTAVEAVRGVPNTQIKLLAWHAAAAVLVAQWAPYGAPCTRATDVAISISRVCVYAACTVALFRPTLSYAREIGAVLSLAAGVVYFADHQRGWAPPGPVIAILLGAAIAYKSYITAAASADMYHIL